jgi:hypothetical protein
LDGQKEDSYGSMQYMKKLLALLLLFGIVGCASQINYSSLTKSEAQMKLEFAECEYEIAMHPNSHKLDQEKMIVKCLKAKGYDNVDVHNKLWQRITGGPTPTD